jgi:hypothetical protein
MTDSAPAGAGTPIKNNWDPEALTEPELDAPRFENDLIELLNSAASEWKAEDAVRSQLATLPRHVSTRWYCRLLHCARERSAKTHTGATLRHYADARRLHHVSSCDCQTVIVTQD